MAKTPLWRSLYLWLSAGTVAAVLALVLSSPAQSYTPLPDRSGPAGTDFQTDAPRADDSALLPSAGPDLSGSPSDDPTPPPNIPPALYRAFLAALEAEASFDYRIHPVETSDTPAGDSDSERFQANSPEFDATFDHQGLHLAPTQDGSWTLGMRLAGYGYDSHTSPVRQRDISASGNRIEFRYDDLALTEWYVNRPAGLEQGFTLGSPPPAPDPSLNADQWLSLLESPDEGVAPYPTRPLLRLDLSLSGDLTPKRSPDRDGIDFSDEDGDVVLRYTGLYVYDARDREVRAHLALSPNSFAILVDDDAAVYPVTIDPMFTSTPSDTLTLSESTQATTSKPVSDTLTIGDSVQSTTTKAVSDTLTLDESDLMATELAKLEASDATSTDEFSKDAVAISGDTAVIGVSLDDTAAGANAGSAYVFRRSAGNTWTQQAHLEASDAAAGDSFGKSVAISGDTIVVGAHLGDTAGGSNTGSAYVFTRSGGVWSEQAELEASDAVGNDFFGTSVAIDGDTVVAGASRDHTAAGSDAGSAYVFTRVTSTWSQQDKLTSTDAAASDNFGVSVAIDGDTVVAGANNDDTAGGANAGSAYVFTRSGSVWSQQDKLEAGDAAASDQFGFSVAVDGDTAVIGALADDTSAGNAAGSAYVFTRSGSVWSEQERLDAGNPAPGNLFGRSVSISGDTAVIGARWDGIGEADVFTRSGSTWTHRATLEASDEAAGHRFGYTVAVDGGTAVIGAYADDTAAGTNAGSAYVFALGSFIDPDDSLTLAEAWSLSPEDVLTLADSSQIAVAQATSDALALADVSSRDFPDNVSLTESAQLAVGLPPGDALNVAESDLMATEQTRLEASDPAVNDVFGVSVAVDGDTAVIGASNDDTVDGGTDAGSVHVFTRSGSVWTLQAQLTSTDAGTDDRFGSSVAIDGDTLVVGANRDDTAAGNTAGSAYVFTRSGSVWTQQAKLTSTDAAASDQFGQSVAIDGDTVVVGASFDDTTAGGTDAGSAYVFTRSGSVWTQQQKLEASDATSTDRFGIYVDIDGDTVVVGASGDDTAAGTDAGSAYVFTRSGSVWSEQDKLEAADAAADDSFGGIVSLSGDTALIGAAQDDTTAGTAAGSAYVFTRSGSVWSQQAKLEAADAAASDQFGSGVAVNGDIAVVGARLDDTPGSNAGSAYIFIRSGVTWSQRAKLEASDETDSDQLNRVDISGSTVVAGARLASSGGESQSGTAYVFLLGSFTLPGDSLTPADSIGLGLTPPDVLTLADSIGLGLSPADALALTDVVSQDFPDTVSLADSAQLAVGQTPGDGLAVAESDLMATELAKLEASDATSTDEFSEDAIAISGDTAVIGVPNHDTAAGANAGSAYVFVRSAGNTWTQQAKLEASDAAANDNFGKSVAISGDTVVVGAYLDDTTGGANAGSAYVFTRSDGVWSEQDKLEASDAAAVDFFGSSVAIDGDTVVAGADRDDTAAGTDAGSAYVFTRSGSVWSQQDKLEASDATSTDRFGIAVAVDGDTAVVGTYFDDTAAGTDAGSAYVFTRSGSVWSEQQKLEAADAAANDNFGFSVDVDGDTAVIGASADDTTAGGANAGSAYVFTRSGSVWSEQQRLDASTPATANLFGRSVAISGDTAVIGARWDILGEADVFTRSGSTWTHRAALEASDEASGDNFGYTVAIDGGTAVVGARLDDTAAGTDAGSAYAFVLGSFITPDDSLTSADSIGLGQGLSPGDVLTLAESAQATTSKATADSLGIGDSATLGLPLGDSITLADSINLGQGLAANDALALADSVQATTTGTTADSLGLADSVTLGLSPGDTLSVTESDLMATELQKLEASDAAANDRFGSSIAIDGDTMVVGVNRDDTGAGTDAGSAYVFTRSGSVWSQQQKLEASDAAAGDLFGVSVGISGDTVVVGASQDDTTAGGTDAGSAYVFTRSGGVWTQQQKLEASDATSTDKFGNNVAIDGDTVIVGASNDDTAAGTDAGSAYVFTRSGSVWSQQQKLEAGDAAADDLFGSSVSISGDTAVIAAAHDDTAAGTDAGSAYVFTRSGSVWSQQQKLEAGDAAASDQFGSGVAVDGDTAVVGARLEDTPASNSGSAYVFTRSGVTWSQQAKLEASEEAAGHQLNRVDISGDIVVAGARLAGPGGAAYVFTRSGSTWSPRTKLEASDGATSDVFGIHVVIDGVTVVVSASLDDTTAGTDAGSVYTFMLGSFINPDDVLTTTDAVTLGLSPTDSLAIGQSIQATTTKVAADSLGLADSVTLGLSPSDTLTVTESDLMAAELEKLEASDGAANDEFGRAVAIGGDTAVIGARFDDTAAGGTDAGSVYVFVRGAGNTWTEQAKLEASDATSTDKFGHSVAIDGDTVVVGAIDGDDGATVDTGAAYVFTRTGSTWSQQAKLNASDAGADERFGQDVDVEGETAVVSAAFDNSVGTDAGSAYVFTRSGSTWSQRTKVVAADAAAGDFFGFSIAMSGGTLVAGAYRDDTAAGVDAGSAYVITLGGFIDPADSLTLADSAIIGLSPTDTVSVSDSIQATTTKATADTLGLADSVTLALSSPAADSLGIVDSVTLGLSPNDTLTISESPILVIPRWAQLGKLLADDDAASDRFGESLAIDGDTAVIGSPFDDTAAADDAGSVYVFTRSGSVWTQQAKLEASDATSTDRFGDSVAIDGDTIVVGAFSDDTATASDGGSAYVFVRTGTSWSEQAKLEPSDAADGDRFGKSVDIDGDTVVVGSYRDDSTGGVNAGSAYVFTRSGSIWSEQDKLEAGDAATSDFFGGSVSISGDTAVIGAQLDDTTAGTDAGSAYVFTRSGSVWSEQDKLEAVDAAASDKFGSGVAVDGDTAVVGARLDDTPVSQAGSAYVFTRSGVSWSQQAKLEASDEGESDQMDEVDISGGTVVAGARLDNTAGESNSGSAYVFLLGSFVDPADSLTLADTVQATTSKGAADSLGLADSVQATTSKAATDSLGLADSVVLGLSTTADSLGLVDSVTLGLSPSDTLTISESPVLAIPEWAQFGKLLADDDAASDNFGWTVAIDGDTAVIGARLDDTTAGTDAGSAYVFVRSGSIWTQQAKLEADNATSSAQFGYSVAIDGDTIVVGALVGDTTTSTDSGVAYVFTRSGTTWSQQATLGASDAANGDQFGISVAVDGDTAVVGAHKDDTGAGADAGSAYVFTRDGSTWSQQAKLEASDADVGDSLGSAVTISGDTAVAGAPGDNTTAGNNAGSAYVFTRSESVWSEQAKLEAPDAAVEDSFGNAVAVDGDTAVIGVHFDDTADGANAGSAYVFTRSGVTWSQQAKLEASDGGTGNQFGHSVAISSDLVVVGARLDNTATGGTNAGSAYAFARSGSSWSERAKLEASDSLTRDQFGESVAISGINVVIGATLDDAPLTDSGSAYFFKGILEPFDTLTPTDAVQLATAKVVADSLSLADSVAFLLPDTVAISESIQLAISKAVADGLTVSDSFTLDPKPADSLGLADSVTLGLSPNDALALAESVQATTSKAVADSLAVGDTVVLGLSPADSININDSIQATTSKAVADSLGLDDSVTMGLSSNDALALAESVQATTSKAMADTLALAESAQATTSKAATDSLAVGDSVVLGLSPADSININDSIQATTSKAVADSVGLADSVTLGLSPNDALALAESVQATSSKAAADSITLGESVILGLSPSDTVNINESIQATTSKAVADSLGLADSVTLGLSPNDALALAESVLATTSKAVGDSITLGESVILGLSPTDTVNINESTQATTSKAVADSLGLADSVTLGLSPNDALALAESVQATTSKAAADSLGLADSVTLGFSPNDALALAESVQATTSKAVGDSITLGESVILGLSPTDSINISESIQATTSKAVADSLGLADSVTLGLSPNDALALAESVQATTSKAATDSITLGESVALGLSPSDTVNINESTQATTSKAAADSLGLADSVTLGLSPNDALVLAESVQATSSKAVGDSLSLADSVTLGFSPNDALALAESVQATSSKAVGDSITLGESVILGLSPTDSINISESIQATTSKAVADSLGLADSVTLGFSPNDALALAESVQATSSKAVGDSITLGESVILGLSPSDTVNINESTQATTSKAVADSLGLADSVELGLSPTDIVNVNDSIKATTSKAVADSLGLADSVTLGLSPNDALALAESVQAASSKAAADSLGLTDSAILGLSPNDALALAESVQATTSNAVGDSITLGESVTLRLSPTDSINISESIQATTSKAAADSLGLADSVELGLSPNDALALAESLLATTSKAVGDSMAVTDSITLSLSPTDAVTIGESIQATTSKAVADSFGLADSAILGLSPNDALALAESVQATTSNAVADSLGLADSVTLGLSPNDALALAESVQATSSNAVADSLGLADSVTLGLSPSDGLGVSDAVQPSISSTPNDAVTLLESVNLGFFPPRDGFNVSAVALAGVGQGRSDALGVSDSVTLVLSPGDDITIADATQVTASKAAADSLAVTDTVALGLSPTDALAVSELADTTGAAQSADLLSITDAVALGLSPADSININDSIQATTSKAVADSIGLVDSVTLGLSRNDALALAESVRATTSKAVGDSFTLGESVTLGLSPTHSINISESIQATTSKAVADSLGLADSATLGLSPNDALALAESVQATTSRAVGDSITLGESVTLGLSPTDSINISESIQATTSKAVGDSITLGESVTLGLSPTDSINISESIQATTSKAVADSLGLADSATLGLSPNDALALAESVQATTSNAVADSVGLADSVILGLSPNDALALAESVQATTSRAVGDSLGLTDTIVFGLSPTDSINISESIQATISKAAADSLGLADSATLGLSPNDALALAESVQATTSKAAADSLGLADSVTLGLSPNDALALAESVQATTSRALGDSIKLGESVTLGLSPTDSINISESIQATTSKAAADSLGLADSATLGLSPNDALALAESVQATTSKAAADSLGLADSATLGLSPNDALALAESVQATTSRAVGDSLGLTDTIVLGLTPTDTLTVSVSAQFAVPLAASDSIGLADTVALQLSSNDGLSVVDTIQAAVSQASTDTLGIAEVVTLGFIRTETLVIAESTKATLSQVRADSLGLSDAVAIGLSPSDSLSVTDAIRPLISPRPDDAVNIVESVDLGFFPPRDGFNLSALALSGVGQGRSDALGISDSATLALLPGDTITITESTRATTSKVAADSLPVTDAVALGLSPSDALAVSEVVGSTGSSEAAESLNITDQVELGLAANDSLGLAEDAFATKVAEATASLGVADSITLGLSNDDALVLGESARGATSKAVADALGIADSVGLTTSPRGTLALAESVRATTSKAVADSLGIADSVSLGTGTGGSLALTESTRVAASKPAADSLSVGDSVGLGTGTGGTLAVAESAQLATGSAVADSLSLVDTVTLVPSIGDGLSLAESTQAATAKPSVDPISVADSAVLGVARSDSLALTDSVRSTIVLRPSSTLAIAQTLPVEIVRDAPPPPQPPGPSRFASELVILVDGVSLERGRSKPTDFPVDLSLTDRVDLVPTRFYDQGYGDVVGVSDRITLGLSFGDSVAITDSTEIATTTPVIPTLDEIVRATGQAIVDAGQIDPEVTGEAVAEAARTDTDITGQAIIEAGQIDPAVTGEVVAEVARVDTRIAGQTLIDAGKIDSGSTGEVIVGAARSDVRTIGQAIAQASKIDPATTGQLVVQAARIDPTATGQAVVEALTMNGNGDGTGASMAEAVAEAAKVDALAAGAAIVLGLGNDTSTYAALGILMTLDTVLPEVTPQVGQDPVSREFWENLGATPTPPITSVLGRFAESDPGASVTVEPSIDPPPGVPPVSNGDVVNTYVRVTPQGFNQNDMRVAHVTFSIEKSWLKENDIHPWSIRFNRYDETTGAWVPFVAKLVGEDETHVFYTVPPARFSLWAISGSTEISQTQIRVDNMLIVPNDITEGQNVTTHVLVTNNGDKTENYNAILWLNDQVFASRLVPIPPKSSVPVSFTIDPPAGSYKVRVDRLLSGLQVKPGPLDFGTNIEQMTISVTNVPVEDAYQTYTVTTDAAWLTVSPSTFDLAPVSSEEMVFLVDRTDLAAGSYNGSATISFEGTRPGTFVVTVKAEVAQRPVILPGPEPQDGTQLPIPIGVLLGGLILLGVATVFLSVTRHQGNF